MKRISLKKGALIEFRIGKRIHRGLIQSFWKEKHGPWAVGIGLYSEKAVTRGEACQVCDANGVEVYALVLKVFGDDKVGYLIEITSFLPEAVRSLH